MNIIPTTSESQNPDNASWGSLECIQRVPAKNSEISQCQSRTRSVHITARRYTTRESPKFLTLLKRSALLSTRPSFGTCGGAHAPIHIHTHPRHLTNQPTHPPMVLRLAALSTWSTNRHDSTATVRCPRDFHSKLSSTAAVPAAAAPSPSPSLPPPPNRDSLPACRSPSSPFATSPAAPMHAGSGTGARGVGCRAVVRLEGVGSCDGIG